MLLRNCTTISVAGYGVQAGATNGQQMKGNGMKPISSLRIQIHSFTLSHTYTEKQHHCYFIYLFILAGYSAQAGGYGGQGTKGKGLLVVMMY